MEQRVLGRAGRKVSVLSLGTWQLGEGWGDVREEDAFALRWIIQQPGVTPVIPGAHSPEQPRLNAAASALPPLPSATLGAVRDLYDRRIRGQVHHRW